MFSRLKLIIFLTYARKKIIFISFLFSTILFSLVYSSFTINNLNSKPIEEFVISIGEDKVHISLGHDINIYSSIKDIENIFSYFQNNIPFDIKKRLIEDISMYTDLYIDPSCNASVIINETTPFIRFDNIFLTFPEKLNDLLVEINSTISSKYFSISKAELGQIDGVLFEDQSKNSSYARISELPVIIQRENDNATIIKYNFLILNSEFKRNSSVLNKLIISDIDFFMTYDKFQEIGIIEGGQNTRITLIFDKKSFVEVVLISNIRKLFLNFLTEFNSHLKIYQWETINNFHLNNEIISLYNLTKLFLTIMNLLLILTLIPSFLVVFYLISFTETIRNQHFNINYFKKLFFRGFSKKFIVFYYLIETVIILFFSIFLGLLIASFIESIIIWQIYGYLEFGLLDKITMILFHPYNNFFPILIVFLVIIFLNKQVLFFFPTKSVFEKENIFRESITEYSLNKLELRSFFLSIVMFSLIIVSEILFEELMIVFFGLILLLFIWSIRVWITYGLLFLGKLFNYFTEKKEKFIVMNIFHKISLSQTRLTTSLFWILFLFLIIPTIITSFAFNYHRDSYYSTGGDLRLDIKFNTNIQDIDRILKNISDIESYTVLNQTITTFGSEYTNSPNQYELIGIDPNSFFQGKWFNKNFLDSLSIEEIITELSLNESILIPINDYKRLNIKKGDELKISGYLNYTANIIQEYHLKIADKINYFPSKTKEQINDLNIQIFTSHTLFSYLIKDMTLSIKRILLIELKQDFITEDLYKYFENIADNVVLNSVLKVEEKSSEYNYSNLMNQLLSIYSKIITNLALLIMIPISFIFLYYLFYKTKNTLGILESLSIKRKNIIQSMILYFISLLFVILIGIGLICILIIPFIISIKTACGLPLSIKIRFDTIMFVICIETFILVLNGLLYKFKLNKMPAELIIQRD